MFDEEMILDKITYLLDADLLAHCRLVIRQNASSSYNSILVQYGSTPFREANELLFARIKTNGKRPFLSFSTRSLPLFQQTGISFFTIKSKAADFIRFDIDTLFPTLLEPVHPVLSKILREHFLSLFAVEEFGCCSQYEACSDAGKCIHSDAIYSLGCQYNKNL